MLGMGGSARALEAHLSQQIREHDFEHHACGEYSACQHPAARVAAGSGDREAWIAAQA